MRLILVLAAVLAPTAYTQGVTQADVTPDDLLTLYDNAVAIEIPIPANATAYSLTFGGTKPPVGMSTFLDRDATTLRVIALLPDEGVVDPCAAEEAEATIVAIPISPRGAPFHNSMKVCVPHPPKPEITGRARLVLEGEAPTLGELRPIVFQAWLVRDGQNEHGGIKSAIDMSRAFTAYVNFTDSSSTAFPAYEHLDVDTLATWPDIAALIEKFGISTDPR